MKIKSIAITIGLAFFGSLSIAQTIARSNVVAQMEFPTGNGAWLVQIFTSDGFTGSGVGDFGVTSEGRMVCSLQTERCPRQVEVLSLQTLIEMVQSVPPVDTPVVIGVCNDCLSRTIVIRHRDTHGTERIYRASWNDVTMSGVPREILQIYDAVVALRK